MPIGFMPVPFQVGLQILSRVSAFRVCHLSDIPGAAYHEAEEIELSVLYYGLHSDLQVIHAPDGLGQFKFRAFEQCPVPSGPRPRPRGIAQAVTEPDSERQNNLN